MKIKLPRAVAAWGSGLILGFVRGRRNKFQQIADLALQNGTKPGKDIGIKASDLVLVVSVQLGSLHFRALSQFCSADFLLLKQFCQVDFYCTIQTQVLTPQNESC